jgi:thiol-disulfide isomerase/thioredoxin
MKRIIFGITLLLVTVLPGMAENTVVIKGKILEYPLQEETSLVIVDIHNLEDDPRQIRREINYDGTFIVEFDLPQAQDIYLRLTGIQLQLLVIPGDTLTIEVNYADRNQKNRRLLVNFSGDGSERNRHLNHMLYQLRRGIDIDAGEPKGLNAKFKELNHHEFRTYRLDIQRQQKEILDKYIQDNDVKDSLLLEWIGYYLDYEPMAHLLAYQTMHAQLNGKKPKDIRIPESYYDFLADIATSNKRALICTNYITFVSRFYYIVKYTNLLYWPPYDSLHASEGMVSAIFQGLNATTEGFAREVILSRFLYEMMGRRDSLSQAIPPLLEKYFDIVTDRHLRAITMKRIELSFGKVQDLEYKDHINMLTPAKDRDLLTSIVHQFSGKVIFIDIWATWCSPCKAEMIFYPEFMQHFHGKDIVFVFLAAFSPEKLWVKQINDLGLPGQHHLLSDKDYYSMEKYLDLKGFPQHIVIDKKGHIVNDHAARICVGDSLNSELLSYLDKLLHQ